MRSWIYSVIYSVASDHNTERVPMDDGINKAGKSWNTVMLQMNIKKEIEIRGKSINSEKRHGITL
jgi:hypothetical protein